VSLRIEPDGPVLRLTLDRPEKHNAIDTALLVGLTAAFASVGDARVVVVRGSGPSFSAGADLGEMVAGIDESREDRLVDARRWHALLEAVDGCPVPVVAGVHGSVLGGACGLLACCDVVVAARDTRFALSEVKVGLVPAVVSPFVVARIGPGQARALFVTGERIGAERALRAGLITEVADDVDAGVERVVEEILGAGPAAVRLAKRIARAPLEAGELTELVADLRVSDEAQEGLRAFLERRPPSWRG
jgi:methylglutaconyl-CoA hydratase